MKNFTFQCFIEGRDKEEIYKTAILTQLGIDPDHADEAMSNTLSTFANYSEIGKLPILNDLAPDVRATFEAILGKPDSSTLQDLISALGKQSDLVPTRDQFDDL